ncbi:MAG: adenosylcobinamide amidohydrolase [Bacteroidota bacterium]
MINTLFELECSTRCLVARFPVRQRMVSWSLNRPGLVEAEMVAWLEVRDADLPIGVDPLDLLERRLAERGLRDAVGLMTARDIRQHHLAVSGDGDLTVQALVTLGLTNGSRLEPSGSLTSPLAPQPVGTINTLVAVSCPLSPGALIEAASVATMARTAALLADHGQIVGTGTDCIVVASPLDVVGEPFAGLHTAIGQHITTAAFRATREARSRWEGLSAE